MARTINMHTDLQISSCWEHIKGTAVFQIVFTQNWCNITLKTDGKFSSIVTAGNRHKQENEKIDSL
jgi:hypothetical protein